MFIGSRELLTPEKSLMIIKIYESQGAAMKRSVFLLLMFLFSLTGSVFAEEEIEVTFRITPFVSKVDGAQPAEVTQVKMVPGGQVTLDLKAMDVTVTAEQNGSRTSFSFDQPLELKGEGVTAEVQKIILENSVTAYLRTPTMDVGADLEISWHNYQVHWLYQQFLHSIKGILNGEENGRYGPYEDYSVMFNVQSFWDEKTLGYTLMDLDNDGTEELLFGDLHPDLTGTPLYDLYTIRQGEIVHVFDGWDRNRYYLTDDGGFLNQGSSSAFHSSSAYFIYTKGELRLIRSVIYDSDKNPGSPWFISYTNTFDSSAALPIREEEAKTILSYYTCRQLELTPFGADQ